MKSPPPPALPTYPYWNASRQVVRFCAGEDEAREYADYLRELGCPATALLPSEWPKQVVPLVVLKPCLPHKESPTGPTHSEEANLYEAFKCYEMQSRATEQHRTLRTLLAAHSKEKNGIKAENLICQIGSVALPGIEVGLQHHVGYHWRKLILGEITQKEWDAEVTRLILDGKMEKPAGHPAWKPQVLLWEGDDDCSSAPSIRFEGKLWTISRVDGEFKLYLAGNEIPGLRLIYRSNAVALAEAYEKVLGDPPAGVAEATEKLIGQRIRLVAFGGERDACGRIAAITDDTIAVVLEGVADSFRRAWFSRYNGRSLAEVGASSGIKITDQILKELDEQFPRDSIKQKSSSERPEKRFLARVAEMQSAQEWFDSTPGIGEEIDLDDLIGAVASEEVFDLDELIGGVR